jgi:hypothetical protein
MPEAVERIVRETRVCVMAAANDDAHVILVREEVASGSVNDLAKAEANAELQAAIAAGEGPARERATAPASYRPRLVVEPTGREQRRENLDALAPQLEDVRADDVAP